MNENIDLTRILKDCPRGTKFYSMVDGDVEFIKITQNKPALICFAHPEGRFCYFKDGRFFKGKGECILFPSKEQRDWSKFVPTWETKKEIVKVTLHPFDKVFVRDDCESLWEAQLITSITDGRIETMDGYTWLCGIPYNKDTAHLLGTNEKCPINYEIEFSKEFK